MTGPGTPTFYFRVDHDLIGRVLAAKLRLRTDRARMDCGFRVVGR